MTVECQDSEGKVFNDILESVVHGWEIRCISKCFVHDLRIVMIAGDDVDRHFQGCNQLDKMLVTGSISIFNKVTGNQHYISVWSHGIDLLHDIS